MILYVHFSKVIYILVKKEHYYLIVIIVLYSRKVIGHQLAKSLGSSELIELMKETYQTRNHPNKYTIETVPFEMFIYI